MRRPEPVLQQPTPLRPPPSIPREIACSVHDKVVDMSLMAGAPINDYSKVNTMLYHDANEVSQPEGCNKSVFDSCRECATDNDDAGQPVLRKKKMVAVGVLQHMLSCFARLTCLYTFSYARTALQ